MPLRSLGRHTAQHLYVYMSVKVTPDKAVPWVTTHRGKKASATSIVNTLRTFCAAHTHTAAFPVPRDIKERVAASLISSIMYKSLSRTGASAFGRRPSAATLRTANHRSRRAGPVMVLAMMQWSNKNNEREPRPENAEGAIRCPAQHAPSSAGAALPAIPPVCDVVLTPAVCILPRMDHGEQRHACACTAAFMPLGQ